MKIICRFKCSFLLALYEQPGQEKLRSTSHSYFLWRSKFAFFEYDRPHLSQYSRRGSITLKYSTPKQKSNNLVKIKLSNLRRRTTLITKMRYSDEIHKCIDDCRYVLINYELGTTELFCPYDSSNNLEDTVTENVYVRNGLLTEIISHEACKTLYKIERFKTLDNLTNSSPPSASFQTSIFAHRFDFTTRQYGEKNERVPVALLRRKQNHARNNTIAKQRSGAGRTA